MEPITGDGGKNIPEQKAPEQKLSFARKDLDTVLNQNPFKPNDLIGLFERDYGAEYAASAGVWEGYTIKEHTLMVMGQFEKYFSHSPLPAGVDKKLFRTILALHDIGKPEAIRMGGKHLQHEYNERKMNTILSQLEFDQQEKDLALALALRDPIGNMIKTGDIETSAAEIIRSARKANVPPEEFFDLLTVFYRVDAGSYTEDAGGQKSLDSLFEFDKERKELRFAPRTNEIITRLKTRMQSLKEVNPVQEKEIWQMTRREFGNKFYVYGEHEHQSYCVHKDKSNSDIQSRKESGVITHGSFVLAKNNDVIEKARTDTEGGGVFLIVSADSLPPNKSLQKPLDIIKISRQAWQSISYIADVPLGLDPHKYFVTQALREGKKVPREVLMQYPFLVRAEGSLSESELSDIEKSSAVKEPWQITRDEFGENYYLHGTTEDKAQLIRQAGYIQNSAFINAAQDKYNTAIAYATDGPPGGGFSKSGRGTVKGTIFIAHINAILRPEDKQTKLDNMRRIRDYNFSPPEVIFEDDYKGRTIPYIAETPDTYNPHKYLVEQALRLGKHVPPEVLEDYPGLEKSVRLQKEIESMSTSRSIDLQQKSSDTDANQNTTPKRLAKIQTALLNSVHKLSQRNK